jgi:hypothetical protein
MSIDTDLVTALGPLVNGRVTRDVFAQANDTPVWPAIRFQLISGDSAPTVCGTDVEDTDDSLYQIDVVASTLDVLNPLVRSVISALQAFPHPNVRSGRRADPYDATTHTYRVSLDYLFSPSSD